MTTIRQDWTKQEVEALYQRPFADLLFEAQQIHRHYFDPNEVVSRDDKLEDTNNYLISRQYLPQLGANMAARDIPTFATDAWTKDTLPLSSPEFEHISIVPSKQKNDSRPWYRLERGAEHLDRPIPDESVLWHDRDESDDPIGGVEVLE